MIPNACVLGDERVRPARDGKRPSAMALGWFRRFPIDDQLCRRTADGDGDGRQDRRRAGRPPAQRNGYRDSETRAGTVEIRIRKPRVESSFPRFLEPRRMAEIGTDCRHHRGVFTDGRREMLGMEMINAPGNHGVPRR
jgi:hypothetical protein